MWLLASPRGILMAIRKWEDNEDVEDGVDDSAEEDDEEELELDNRVSNL